MGNNRFFDGFLLGLLIGGAAVFLLGTKSGKNLLKILSEQGLEGVSDLIDEYNQDFDEDDLDAEAPIAEEKAREAQKAQPKEEVVEEYTSERPKKRFFKRFK